MPSPKKFKPKSVKKAAKAAKKPKPALADEDARFADLFSLANLRKTWRSVRKEARTHSVRDAIDWLDWSVRIEATLPQIQRAILSGEYVPSSPARFELAKAHGSYRSMTIPNFRDAVVFRLVSDTALELANPHKVPGAFFSRRHGKTPIGKTFTLRDDPYLRFFDIWRRYHEYRTLTLLSSPYEVLVVSDITNYFDSISHELLMEYLAPLGLPRKAIGLLGRILAALKPPAGHSRNPRIGIPVDEFDCSRQLAHVFLFEHDHRMVKAFGETNYVRWMDDQNIGAESFTEARRIVNLLTRSLSAQRLTVNSGKTRFLTPEAVPQYFQLSANKLLNTWEDVYKNKFPKSAKDAERRLQRVWRKISGSKAADKGRWDKVLKRMYAAAARVDSSLMDARMYDDLLAYPDLCGRIFESLARRGEGVKLAGLFEQYCDDGECLFEATEAAFFEACLLLDASGAVEKRIRRIAREFAKGSKTGQTGRPHGKASAILCLYWFGLSAKRLLSLFTHDEATHLPPSVARAWLACVTAKNAELLPKVQAKLVGHPSPDVAQLSRFLDDLRTGSVEEVGPYKSQKLRWPKPGKFYDARAWLQLEVISWAGSRKLLSVAKSDARAFGKLTRTSQEKRRLAKIQGRLP